MDRLTKIQRDLEALTTRLNDYMAGREGGDNTFHCNHDEDCRMHLQPTYTDLSMLIATGGEADGEVLLTWSEVKCLRNRLNVLLEEFTNA